MMSNDPHGIQNSLVFDASQLHLLNEGMLTTVPLHREGLQISPGLAGFLGNLWNGLTDLPPQPDHDTNLTDDRYN